jgi:DNA polymerase elongation subunit (family B)
MKAAAEPLKLCILDADHVLDGGRQVIRLWCKTRGGKTVVVLDDSFRPYFYVEPRNETIIPEIEKKIGETVIEGERPETIEVVEKNIFGKVKKIIKVVIPPSGNVPQFREIIRDLDGVKDTYEYALSSYRRYMMDNNLVPMQWVEVRGTELKGKMGETIRSGLTADIVIKPNDIKPLPKEPGYPVMNVLAFDIEVIRERGVEKIVMASFMDNRGFKRAITYGSARSVKEMKVVKNEKELIQNFTETIRERNPDILVGYNSDAYDLNKLDERARENGIPLILGRDDTEPVFRRRERISAVRIFGRMHIDIYNFVKNILGSSMSTEALTLSKVSGELLGLEKDDITWSGIEKAWRKKELRVIAEHCMRDSELTLKLSEYILPQVYELCKVVGQMPFDISRMSYSQLVEWLFIRKVISFNGVAANRPKYDEIMRRRRATAYTGGYVHPPKDGLHEKIALFDFASLYPSIIITHNISPETLDCGCCGNTIKNSVPVEQGEERHHFCTKSTGFIPVILKELVDKRRSIERMMSRRDPKTIAYRNLNNMQYALKILANASYGYYGYAGSRWYSRIAAESITAWGRFYIKKVIRLAQRMKLPVIYGDTDSLFVKVRNREQVRDFREKANRSLSGVMELDFRNMYKSGIFVRTKTGVAAKKRYALIDNDNILTIRGFETVRRDWAQIAKDTQEKVLIAVLKDRSPGKAIKIARGIIDDVRNKRIKNDEMIIHNQITKPLDQYEQIGPHVAAARKYTARGVVVRAGSTISFIITKGTGSISARAEPAEYAENYDPDYYINNQIVPAALRVLSVLGYTEEDLLGKQKERSGQSSLEGFLKQ